MNKLSGLDKCVEAFERLKKGTPRIPEHIGLSASEITAGIVSVEAGWDRGYLKRSRENHKPLISLIDAYRADYAKGSTHVTKNAEIQKQKKKVLDYKKRCDEAEKRLYEALGRELILVAKIRELELELTQFRNIEVF